MNADTEHGHATRMLFLGDPSLADGFRLIGFETFPNPAPEEADRVFRELQRSRESAFVLVDDRLMQAQIPGLQELREEGGRIVVVAVPALKEPRRLASDVAERLAAMFGSSNIMGQTDQ